MSIRNRAYPGPEQAAALSRHCNHARFVWNLAVEQQSWWRPGRAAAPGAAARQRQLAQARDAEPWLRDGSSSVQQQALRDFDRALAAFFDPQNPAGRPAFRSRRGRQGFVIRDTKVRRLSRRWGEVSVPKCGWVRFRWTRSLPGMLGMARVTRDGTGRWHVSFPGAQPPLPRERSGKAVGLDRGVRTALVDSDGQHYRAPRISDRRAARYLVLQRRMSRQHKGSRKREGTRQAMARIAAQVAGRRKDWAEKVSTRLVRGKDIIVLEKLNIPAMTRRPNPKPDPHRPGTFLANRARAKAGLSRGILSSCWGQLGRRLEEKGGASGVFVIKIDPHFTSQECRVCGCTTPDNRENQAFRCQSCGHEDHADVNAACNILARGLLLISGEVVPAHAPGHGAACPREPAQAAAGTTRITA